MHYKAFGMIVIALGIGLGLGLYKLAVEPVVVGLREKWAEDDERFAKLRKEVGQKQSPKTAPKKNKKT